MLSDPTCHRLRQLPLLDTVWEGDRVSFGSADWDPLVHRSGRATPQSYLFWIDGVRKTVRAMDALTTLQDHETIVRTLIQAMEDPLETQRQPSKPGRPRKIVVRDRELHFFLRGVLQDLDIKVEYKATLPVAEQLTLTLLQLLHQQTPALSKPEQQWLQSQSQRLWEVAPWQTLCDHQILVLRFPHLKRDPLYVSVLGKLALEFGLLFYRSVESLQEFRHQMLHPQQDSPSAEEAFLRQDCFYLTYLTPPLDAQSNAVLAMPQPAPVEVGSIHPIEGIRPHLWGEEFRLVMVAIEAVMAFFKQYHSPLSVFPKLTQEYCLDLPPSLLLAESPTCTVTVETLPHLAQTLQHSPLLLPLAPTSRPIALWSPPRELLDSLQIQQTLIPDRALVSMGQLPWAVYASLEEKGLIRSTWSPVPEAPLGEGLPIILIQGTLSQAKAVMGAIEAAGGLEAIGFNPGHDPLSQMVVDLGLLKLHSGLFEVFGEYNSEGQSHRLARQKWDQRTQTNGGRCGLLLAKGVMGPSQGNPGLQDLVQLWEVPAWSAEQLGLGMLRLQPLSLSRP